MKGRHEPGVRIEKYTYPERAADFDQVPPRRPYAYRVLVPLLLRNAVRPIPFEDRRDWSVDLVRSEPVTARLRFLQISNMPFVQDVEATVSHDQTLAPLACFGSHCQRQLFFCN